MAADTRSAVNRVARVVFLSEIDQRSVFKGGDTAGQFKAAAVGTKEHWSGGGVLVRNGDVAPEMARVDGRSGGGDGRGGGGVLDLGAARSWAGSGG